jgi:hypothetical protein
MIHLIPNKGNGGPDCRSEVPPVAMQGCAANVLGGKVAPLDDTARLILTSL